MNEKELRSLINQAVGNVLDVNDFLALLIKAAQADPDNCYLAALKTAKERNWQIHQALDEMTYLVESLPPTLDGMPNSASELLDFWNHKQKETEE